MEVYIACLYAMVILTNDETHNHFIIQHVPENIVVELKPFIITENITFSFQCIFHEIGDKELFRVYSLEVSLSKLTWLWNIEQSLDIYHIFQDRLIQMLYHMP